MCEWQCEVDEVIYIIRDALCVLDLISTMSDELIQSVDEPSWIIEHVLHVLSARIVIIAIISLVLVVVMVVVMLLLMILFP